MDDKVILDWAWKIGSSIIAIIIAIYGWWTARGKATAEQIEEAKTHHNEVINNHEKRLISMESSIKNAPTHDDLSKIYDKLNHTQSSLDVMSGEFKGMSRSLSRIENWLTKDK